MSEIINWSKLKPYNQTKYSSFEQLCYQIAKGLYEEQGTFTPVDDSGGGDGVEFYLTLPNGDQWGWQAKFFFPNKRLSESGRKNQIISSFKKSCEVHTHLKKWFLCTPTNFTTDEQKWFDNILTQMIPSNMKLELTHWGDNDLNNWLSMPKFAGKLHYFFGELELKLEWFRNQVETQIAIIKEKFNPNLHIETYVDQEIDNLTVNEVFITDYTKELKEFLKNIGGNELINEINKLILKTFNWGDKKSEIDNYTQNIQGLINDLINDIQSLCSFFDARQIKKIKNFDLDAKYSLISESYKNLRARIEIDFSTLEYIGNEENKKNTIEEAEKIKETIISILIYLIDHLYLAKLKLKTVKTSDLHIFGMAGTGKTHIVSHICMKKLASGIPALLVLGNRFGSTQPLREQLLRIFDIPPTYGWNNFLQALSAAAEAYQTRIPLVIDGLNESTQNGIFSNIWCNELQGLIQEISEIQNVVIITTCRSSYMKAIWGDNNPSNSIKVTGFEDYNVKEAVERYFEHYKIKANIGLTPLNQFKHPIYLKIFCETKNPSKEKEIYLSISQETLFEVFDKFLSTRNTIICERLGLYPKTPLLGPIFNELANYFWENHCRSIPLKELVELTDNRSLEQLNWYSSRAKAILDEGLVVFREMGEGNEVVNFTYDLFGGFLIAQYLILKNQDHIENFVNSERVSNALFNGNLKTLHPLYEDIGQSLAILLPIRMNRYLHNLLDTPDALNLSVRALFEINPKAINQECVDFISKLFEKSKNRKSLFELAKSTITFLNHPLNTKFWSKQLKNLGMSDRDISWTEYIRDNPEYFDNLIKEFEGISQSTEELSEIDENVLHLFAEYLMWMLTSTIRNLRDRTTRALYYYGRRYPNDFLKLLLYSLDINDFYVPERMLAATYGIMMARQYEFGDSSFKDEIMPKFGRKLYEMIFSKDATYSTTHILARDYAKYSIDIALMHHPTLLTIEEQQSILSPFKEGGIREWGEVEDRDEGMYRDGNGPIHMDFMNYTLGQLVKDRNNYDFDHPEYVLVLKNIFWRIYQLGYSLETFGEIDKSIARLDYYRSGSREGGGKIDRYGKKYSWIAFYELAGFRKDQGLLDELYDENVHISDVDLDPSFPIELQSYNLVQHDFLGERKLPVQDWILNGENPIVDPYLIIGNFDDNVGPWVLLDGFINQEEFKTKRSCFVYVHGVIVKKREAKLIKKRLDQNNPIIRLSEIPEDYYTYAGEIPWCTTYPLNPEKEPVISLLDSKEDFDGLIPIRRNTWESYHTELDSGRNVRTLAKQIALHLDLCGQPQTFDLFEKSGNKAIISFHYGEEFGNRQEFIYIRKNLLESYLKTTKNELIWVVWGEREFKSKDQTEYDSFAQENEVYKKFQDVKILSKI